MNERTLEGQVGVVTGASGGLGACVAEELARRGASVVLAARRGAELDAIRKRCGDGALAVVADTTKRADVQRIFDEAIAKLGRVDIWVNNVGRGQVRPVLQLTDEDIDAMTLVNVKSALYGMQVAVPHFMQRGTGAIVNVSTVAARIKVMYPVGSYAASKAAMSRLSEELRGELAAAHPGIRVVNVYPGVIATEFGNNSEGPHADSRMISGAQPPEDVARILCDALLGGPLDVYTQPGRAQMVRDYFEKQLT